MVLTLFRDDVVMFFRLLAHQVLELLSVGQNDGLDFKIRSATCQRGDGSLQVQRGDGFVGHDEHFLALHVPENGYPNSYEDAAEKLYDSR